MLRETTVSEHTNGDLKDYALYTIYARAIPSMIDGFKPSQRKAVFTATKVAKASKVKTLSLIGQTFTVAKYHHGDASMADCINKLAAEHNNNVPILEGEGTFGSRLVPAAASPRYTDVGLSKVFEQYFPDIETCPSNNDIESPEPKNYLPIIPWLLVNGAKGIATGFACNILPRSVEDISDLCVSYMLGNSLPLNVAPTFPKFNGNVSLDGKSWVVSGRIVRKSATNVIITELPIGYNREKYIDVLNSLEEKGTIVSFVDECSKVGFKFVVKLPRASKSLSDGDMLKKLKLIKRFTENITTIDQDGKLKIYDNVVDLVVDFCEYRVERYKDRYSFRIARDKTKRDELVERLRFIDMVLQNKIDFKTSTKAQVLNHLSKMKFTKEHREKFVDMPIYSLTKDAAARTTKDILSLDKSIKLWQSINCKKQYIKELNAIQG